MKEYSAFFCYPLEEYYVLCERYLKSRINWNDISKEIKQNDVSYFAISDVVRLFSHLELDENYELICYLGREYHGIWGRIAAMKKNENYIPGKQASILFWGSNFQLPESAVPPMEAIYHDGTNEGFLEAVLCSFLIEAIPYLRFENRNLEIILNSPPSDLSEYWNIIVDIKDWTLRRVNNSIIAFKRDIENGFGGSDGKDRICLTQFNFKRNLGMDCFLKVRSEHSMYRNHIEDDKRYNENRYCCVFDKSSVLIAEEL